MVSARSGCRAISTRKSTRSSTSSRVTFVVVTLAPRTLLPSSAISPKNAPSPSAHFLAGQFDLDLAGGDEIHAVALLALADDHGARRQLHRSQHVGDVGDRGRAERREERHLADGFPRLEEIVAAGLGGKAGRQNTGPEPEHAEAGDHHHCRHHAAERRDRHHVAIAGRGQRHHRPPQRRRHAAEGLRLHVALQEIFCDRRQKHHHQEDHEHAEQRPRFQHQHAAQLPQPGDARHHLEHPEDAEQPRRPGLDAREQRDRHGKRADRVDDPAAEKRVERQPPLPRHMAQPHQPFEHEIDEARPQHRVDPVVRRLVGRVAR